MKKVIISYSLFLFFILAIALMLFAMNNYSSIAYWKADDQRALLAWFVCSFAISTLTAFIGNKF